MKIRVLILLLLTIQAGVFIFKFIPFGDVSKVYKVNKGTIQDIPHTQHYLDINTEVSVTSKVRNETFQSFPQRQQHADINVDMSRLSNASNETFQSFPQKHKHSNINNTDDLNITFTHLIQSTENYSVDCKALFNASEYELNKAKKLVKTTPNVNPEVQANVLVNWTTSCERYIKTRGYVMSGMAEKEVDFPIAYSIIIHTDVLQVEHLLRAIYRPQNIYCIHVDAKSSNEFFNAIKSVANCFQNVFLSDTRISVKWGKMSVLEVELICMTELLKKNRFWKYFINLTGQEFPLKTNAELVDILTVMNGSNSVSGEISWQYRKRFEGAGPAPMTIVKGHVHIVVNREFVQFAVHDARANQLLDWATKTYIPDELFFSSLNFNPALKIPGSYKYTDSKVRGEPFINRYKLRHVPCKGRKLRGVCLLGVDYLPELSNARELFANKFVWNDDNLGLHCLHQLLYNKTRDEYKGLSNFNASWYSTLDLVVNKL